MVARADCEGKLTRRSDEERREKKRKVKNDTNRRLLSQSPPVPEPSLALSIATHRRTRWVPACRLPTNEENDPAGGVKDGDPVEDGEHCEESTRRVRSDSGALNR